MCELGPLTFGKKEEQIFLGREIAQHRDFSEDTAIRIDEQVKKLVQGGYDTKKEHSDAMVKIAETLLEREILDGNEVMQIISGATLPSDELDRLEGFGGLHALGPGYLRGGPAGPRNPARLSPCPPSNSSAAASAAT